MAIIRWSRKIHACVQRKLTSGLSPEAIKESFCNIVDSLCDTPEFELKSLKSQVAKLKRQLAYSKKKTEPETST